MQTTCERGARGKLIAALVAAAALLVPVAALADDAAPTPASVANQLCKQQQASMGVLFNTTYGTNASRSNAFGQCVAKSAGAAQQDVANAAKTCKTEQADPNFSASHGGKTFDQYYGATTSKGKGGGKNAFGKCVSTAAKASADAQAKAAASAARSCKADRKADPAAFTAKYGSARNAFGKCVAAKSKSK